MLAGSTEALLRLADALDAKSITLQSSPVGLRAVKGVPDDLASAAFRSFSSLDGELDETAVAAVIRTAAEIRDVERLDSPKVEVTWTGPKAEGPLVIESAAAIERCLKECRQAGEVLLVGYSLTVARSGAMNRVISLLVDASRSGAKVQVVLHKDEAVKSWDEAVNNRDELLKHWDVFVPRPKIYTWVPPADHPYTKLHAKCLVVDRLQMIVTSANFTFHGLESNIELGLLVRNQRLASAVHERFDLLINSGVLREWKDYEKWLHFLSGRS